MWQQYEDWLYYHETLGIFLDVSRMRFTQGLDGAIAQMQPQFDQAFRDVAALESGVIANPDEQRMVGHYWLRNPDLAPTLSIQAEIVSTLAQIHEFADRVHSGSIHPPDAPRFTDVLLIGIGGSALGPQFVSEALAAIDSPLAIHFIDNTDPAGIDRTLARLKDRLASTLVLVTSKSGQTPETRNGMIEVQHVYAARGLGFAQHAVAITGRNSQLEQTATTQGWLGTFLMPDWVGGRTSELSAVGLLPAALQGIDIDAMLTGAKVMDDATRVPTVKNNPAALLALGWHQAGAGKGSKDMVLLPYKDSLLLFSRYLQQLVMESLGKEKDLDGNVVHQGLAVYGNKGSTDQHAYVQQLRDGIPNFFVTFIEVLEDRQGESIDVESQITSGDFLSGSLQGTRRALHDRHRDSITLTLPRIDPVIIGALIALYERSVSLYASLIHINAYHQPGVEAGKQAATEILALQRQILSVLNTVGQPLSLGDLAVAVSRPDEMETIYTIVRHLHANRRLSVTGNWGRPASLAVQSKR